MGSPVLAALLLSPIFQESVVAPPPRYALPRPIASVGDMKPLLGLGPREARQTG